MLQLTRAEGERERQRAGIILGIHRRHDQVMAAAHGAVLHVLHDRRDLLAFEEHHHHGGQDEVVFAAEAVGIEILHHGAQAGQLFGVDDLIEAVYRRRVLVPAVTSKPFKLR